MLQSCEKKKFKQIPTQNKQQSLNQKETKTKKQNMSPQKALMEILVKNNIQYFKQRFYNKNKNKKITLNLPYPIASSTYQNNHSKKINNIQIPIFSKYQCIKQKNQQDNLKNIDRNIQSNSSYKKQFYKKRLEKMNTQQSNQSSIFNNQNNQRCFKTTNHQDYINWSNIQKTKLSPFKIDQSYLPKNKIHFNGKTTYQLNFKSKQAKPTMDLPRNKSVIFGQIFTRDYKSSYSVQFQQKKVKTNFNKQNKFEKMICSNFKGKSQYNRQFQIIKRRYTQVKQKQKTQQQIRNLILKL